MNEIRALAVRQPFAWAICAGVKRTENRSWSTERRGTIAIHASTSVAEVREMQRETGCPFATKESFTFGAAIGLADILDVQVYGPEFEDDSSAFGPYCWRMGNGRFLKQPIPTRGGDWLLDPRGR